MHRELHSDHARRSLELDFGQDVFTPMLQRLLFPGIIDANDLFFASVVALRENVMLALRPLHKSSPASKAPVLCLWRQGHHGLGFNGGRVAAVRPAVG